MWNSRSHLIWQKSSPVAFILGSGKQERIFGRPAEVRDPAVLVELFGTRIPLGYLAHATQYPRPDLGGEIVEVAGELIALL
jgi:hypothetical protein